MPTNRDPKKLVKAGDRFSDEFGNLRVMAVAEGYAMCRRTGAMPHIRTVAEVLAQMQANAGPVDAILEAPGAH